MSLSKLHGRPPHYAHVVCSSLASFVLIACMLACGGGSNTNTKSSSTTLSITPTSANVLLGNSQQFTCNVSCGSWGVSGTAGGNSTAGTIASTGLYTAPSDLPSNATVTISAVEQANSSQTANASAVIQSDIMVTITGTASVQLGGSLQLSAVISSAGNPDRSVTWAVNGVAGGNATSGTISATGLYTAPSTLPNPLAVTITATSVADPSKNATTSVTISGTIASQSEQISAAAGGTITLPDGSGVVIPAGALNSDQMVTLSEVTILPVQPPNGTIVSVGTALVLTLSAPNSTQASSSSTDLQFTIMEGTANGIQGAAPIVNAVDTSGNNNFLGATGPYSGVSAARLSRRTSVKSFISYGSSGATANISTAPFASVSSIAVSLANFVLSGTYTTAGGKTLTDDGWTSYAPGASCPSSALVLVHGMNSSVEGAFPEGSNQSCASDIQNNGNYDQVFGFDYDWTQDINASGQNLADFLNTLSTACPDTKFDIEAHSEGVPVTLSAVTLASASTQQQLQNVVGLGGPVMGTPVANTAQNMLGGLLNLQSGVPITGNISQGLQQALSGNFTTGLATNSAELATIRQKFAALSNVNNLNINLILAAGNNSSPEPSLANQQTGFPANTPNDMLIPVSSALGADSGIPNQTQLGPFPVNHTGLECNEDVQSSVGTQIALNPQPTALNFILPSDGSNPADQTVQLSNSRISVAWNASVTDGAPWLSISPDSGNTPDTIAVSVDASALNIVPATSALTLIGTYSSGTSVTVMIPVNVSAASTDYSGSFSGMITDDENGPCPGATADMEGGGTITLTPAGSGTYSVSGQITLNQDAGLCNDYSGQYSVVGGVDGNGNVAFGYIAGTAPPAVIIAFTGTMADGTISGDWGLAGGIDSQGNYADVLNSSFSMNQESSSDARRKQFSESKNLLK